MDEFERNNEFESENETAQEFEAEIIENTKKTNWKKEILDWIISILIAVVLAIVVRNYVFTLVHVEGLSMYPTLDDADVLYVNRFMYQPEVGDIIVFRPPNSPTTPYIKRVIATEGQEVVIDSNTGSVTVDGVTYEENYISEPLRSAGTMEYPYVVPKGKVFVLGDNRNDSRDSRDATVGAVPIDNIMGKAIFRILPIVDFGSVYK